MARVEITETPEQAKLFFTAYIVAHTKTAVWAAAAGLTAATTALGGVEQGGGDE